MRGVACGLAVAVLAVVETAIRRVEITAERGGVRCGRLGASGRGDERRGLGGRRRHGDVAVAGEPGPREDREVVQIHVVVGVE